MKKAQKIIKYVAIAFGLYLAINIIGWIVFGFTMLLGIDIGKNIFYDESETGTIQYGQVFYDVEELDIEITFADFEVKIGDELKLERQANENLKVKVEGQVYEDFEIKVENKILKIKDIDEKWIFNSNDASHITLYVPEDLVFSKANIKIGAGTTNIEKLKATNLNFNLGAGSVNIKNCEAEKTDIECGAGKVEISNSLLKNLDLDTGVGEFSYGGHIIGNSSIECGIGKLTLNLEGGEELYSIEAEHGIGEIKLNGKKIEENQKQGSGENRIKIEGGIGEIQINM